MGSHQSPSFVIDVKQYEYERAVGDFELLNPSAKQCLRLRLVSTKYLPRGSLLMCAEYQIRSVPWGTGAGDVNDEKAAIRENILVPCPALGTHPIYCYVAKMHVANFYSGTEPQDGFASLLFCI